MMVTATPTHTWAGVYPALTKPVIGKYSPNHNIDKVIALALGQVGFVEGVNNDNPYGASVGMNHEPYCCLGVSWTFRNVGLVDLVAGQYSWGYAECQGALNIFASKGLVLPHGTPAKAGDIAMWAWDNPNVAEHTELIIEDQTPSGLVLVGWNTSPDHANGSQANGGGTYLRHRSVYGLKAIVRPRYPQ
jgi:hypothetical protein